MINRRELLNAAAVLAVPSLAAAQSLDTRAISRVLIDERHAPARALGIRLAATGRAVYRLAAGDLTSVWIGELEPVWRDHPVPLAGLTESSTLFCLEELTLRNGGRVVFHAEHVEFANGELEHAVLRGADPFLCARELRRAGRDWPRVLAQLLSAYPESLARARPGRSVAGLAAELPPGAQLLSSWILAPA